MSVYCVELLYNNQTMKAMNWLHTVPWPSYIKHHSVAAIFATILQLSPWSHNSENDSYTPLLNSLLSQCHLLSHKCKESSGKVRQGDLKFSSIVTFAPTSPKKDFLPRDSEDSYAVS